MSASKKLKALNGEMTDPPWGKSGVAPEGYDPERDLRAVQTLRNALPLIADVVEAAEQTQHLYGALKDSLTALRERLEGAVSSK